MIRKRYLSSDVNFALVVCFFWCYNPIAFIVQPTQGGVPMSAETVALAKGVTRREFLNYVWGATMAVFMAEMGGAVFLYALISGAAKPLPAVSVSRDGDHS